jgi:hypothetical protein
MLERIAQRVVAWLMRLASRVGDVSGPKEPNALSRALYRLGEAVVAVCGGTLETRIVSLRAPEGSDAETRLLLERLSADLGASGIPMRVKETVESGREGEAGVRLYECFVRPHHYWRGSAVVLETLGQSGDQVQGSEGEIEKGEA